MALVGQEDQGALMQLQPKTVAPAGEAKIARYLTHIRYQGQTPALTPQGALWPVEQNRPRPTLGAPSGLGMSP